MTILSPRRKIAGYRCQAVFQISGLMTPLCTARSVDMRSLIPNDAERLQLSAPDYPEKRENAPRTNIQGECECHEDYILPRIIHA